jgi:endothelin-converting enzyme/putative endopeptidase
MHLRRSLALVVALSAPAIAQTAATPAAADRPFQALPYTPSLDVAAMDRTVDPCANFYQYSCGGWQKANPIPADQAGWSVYGKLYVDNLRLLWGLLETAAQPRPDRSPVERQIGDYFSACMDEPAIDLRGLDPLRPDLDAIAALSSTSAIAPLVARLHLAGASGLFNFGSEQDAKNSSRFIAAVYQGGLGLPDRDYYLKTDGKFPENRARYLEHVTRTFELLGDPAERAAAEAKTVLAIETSLAEAALSRVERRDPYKNYHLLPVAELEKAAPEFAWKSYFEASGLAAVSELNIQNPAFVTRLGEMLHTRALDDWKVYLRWHLARSASPYLSKPFRDATFDFYRAYLRGVKQQPPRWKSCVGEVDNQLGEALGRIYVEKAFSPELKAAALDMTERIQRAMERRIQALDWMGDATKQQALVKLHGMVNKIGYPDRWRDYSAITVDRADYFGNLARSNRFESARQLAKIGQPLDRGEWFMTPPTVNAYYNPQMNDINFPAGVLQPPLYDGRIDAAPNYGDTGGTIGHELVHGFDDEGRQFDAQGNLRDWWTKEDDERFRARAQCVIDQYSSYTIVDDIKINGKLTAGEDIADFAGLILAWEAWKGATAAEKLADRDGLTPEQRFFVGFAQWDCANEREENLRLQAVTNPHSPPRYRINGVAVNMPEFARAFGCHEGQPMVKSAAQVCRIW